MFVWFFFNFFLLNFVNIIWNISSILSGKLLKAIIWRDRYVFLRTCHEKSVLKLLKVAIFVIRITYLQNTISLLWTTYIIKVKNVSRYFLKTYNKFLKTFHVFEKLLDIAEFSSVLYSGKIFYLEIGLFLAVTAALDNYCIFTRKLLSMELGVMFRVFLKMAADINNLCSR